MKQNTKKKRMKGLSGKETPPRYEFFKNTSVSFNKNFTFTGEKEERYCL